MRNLFIFVTLMLSAMMPGTGMTAQSIGIAASQGQEQDPPVTWRATARMTDSDKGVITLTATMAPGWHLYGMEMPEGGPRATAFTYSTDNRWALIGETTADHAVTRKHDTMFNAEVQYWEGKVVFTQRFRLTGKEKAPQTIGCTVSYMGCNDETCLPPQKKEFTIRIQPKK